MLRSTLKKFSFQINSCRNLSTTQIINFKVTVVGAAGGIGQPLSLLLKRNKLITELSLYDIMNTPGVAADLSHIDTPSIVKGYEKDKESKCPNTKDLDEAVCGSDIVVCPGGMPRKPGMSRSDLFELNAGVVKDLAASVARKCPDALLAIITNPVNSVVPVAAEILKKKKVYNPNKLFGVTTLDIVRARAFIGAALKVDPETVDIPIIGGHSGTTILPIFSQCKPKFTGCQSEIEALITRIQGAGTEVVEAKAGKGSATLSMAHSAAIFVNSLLMGLSGADCVIEYAYVQSDVTCASFFSTALVLGKCGIEQNLGLPEMNEFEKKLLDEAVPQLQENIKTGVDFGGKSCG